MNGNPLTRLNFQVRCQAAGHLIRVFAGVRALPRRLKVGHQGCHCQCVWCLFPSSFWVLVEVFHVNILLLVLVFDVPHRAD